MNIDGELAGLLEHLMTRGLGDVAGKADAAFRLATRAHERQQRSTGEPYVVHPLAVARLLVEEWGVDDADLVVAALLHDTVEDAPEVVSLELIGDSFGPGARELVDLLTKARPAGDGPEAKAARDASYFARLAAGPVGARLVKAADRVDNLRDVLVARWPEEKKRAYCAEALEKILPLLTTPAAAGAARDASPDQREAQLVAQAAKALGDTAREVLRRLDGGEGDVPDVGPNDEVADAGPDADPLLRRSAHVSFFRRGPDVFLYHDLVGDVMQLHEKVIGFIDAFAQPLRASEARTRFRGEFLDGDLDAFFEVLTQHLVLLADDEDDAALTATWYPVRGPWILSYRAPGQPLRLCYTDRRKDEVVVETLPPLLGRLFELCQGALSLPEIVARLRKELPKEEDLERKVLVAVRSWTHSRRQLLKLLPRTKEAFDLVGLPPYVHSTMPYPSLREAEAKPEEPSLRDYHKLEIKDALEQFERRETTLSHAFRVPHPALGNRPFAGQLARVLVDRDVIPDDAARTPLTVVEVGGGTGFFARALLDGIALRAPRTYNRLKYLIVDLAPALSRSQRERAAPHKDRLRVLTGDACALPLPDASVDVLISNEMIADLPTLPVRREDLAAGQGPGEALVRRYDLPVQDAHGAFHINAGAIQLLEQCARVLKPGGTAYLSEFGSATTYPEQSTHLDHAEFSIHFGHLKHVADKLGLEATLEPLASLVQLDGRVKVLQTTQSFFAALSAFLGQHGVKVEKIAYTEDMLKALVGDALAIDRLEGLKFVPCGQRVLGLKPPEFKALLIRKPRVEGRAVQRVSVDV